MDMSHVTDRAHTPDLTGETIANKEFSQLWMNQLYEA